MEQASGSQHQQRQIDWFVLNSMTQINSLHSYCMNLSSEEWFKFGNYHTHAGNKNHETYKEEDDKEEE